MRSACRDPFGSGLHAARVPNQESMEEKRSSTAKARAAAKRHETAKPRKHSAKSRQPAASKRSTGKGTKMKAYATFDLYLRDQTPKNQRIIRALRRFVAKVAPQLDESVKWGNGCWVSDRNPICYVYSAPDYVQLGFFRGASLADLRGLLKGQGQYVRHVKVRALADVDEAAFAALLRQAVR